MCVCGHPLERHFEADDQAGFREAVRAVYSEAEIAASGGLRGCAFFKMVKLDALGNEKPKECECPAFRANAAQVVLL